MYVPFAQLTDGVTALNSRLTALGWVVRTRGEPYALSARDSEGAARGERRAAGGRGSSTMDEIVVAVDGALDFNMLLLTVFGCAALLLAAIGVYGLMAYSVEQRTQEIGIRLALGAELGQVRNMVIAAGNGARRGGRRDWHRSAFALSRLIDTLLFGVTARDPAVFVAVSAAAHAGVAARGLAAGPARDADRSDHRAALRIEKT